MIEAAPDGRWLIMELLRGPAWSDTRLLSDAGIDVLGNALQQLHSLDCGSLPRVDAAGIALGYLEAIIRNRAELDGVSAQVEDIERDSRELQRLSDRAVLNHGDLMAANILGAGRPRCWWTGNMPSGPIPPGTWPACSRITQPLMPGSTGCCGPQGCPRQKIARFCRFNGACSRGLTGSGSDPRRETG